MTALDTRPVQPPAEPTAIAETVSATSTPVGPAPAPSAIATSAATTEATPYRWRWPALAVILAGSVMELLDATVTNVAGPTMRAHLGGGTSLIQWLGAAYTLAMTAGLLIGGRLGDIVGRKRMFLIGVAGFTVGSLLCALAFSPETIIAARIVQGLFGAAMIPQGMGLMKEMFPPKELAAAMGLFGPVMGLSAVGGPILAGALTSIDWRLIFLINLPIGAAAALAALRFLPASRPVKGTRLDLTGAVLASAGVVLLVFPLVQGREYGWPVWSFAMMAASVVVLALFAVHQRRKAARGGDPLVAPSLFAKPAFVSGMATGAIYFAAFAGFFLIVGLYTQLGLEYSPLKAALTGVPSSIGMIAGMGLAQAARNHGRKVLLAGTIVMMLGVMALIAVTSPEVSPWQLAPALALTGLGSGLIMSPYFGIVMSAVDPEETGSASGTLSALQQVGSALGLALLGTVYFGTGSVDITLWAAAAMIAATFLVGLLLPKQPTGHPHH
ncbi:drug resistance transporter, EmrB/QacA subfamily [Nonomuraea solani]|uniref:Drug resistance transporter, EmrB/QacA subfamily n=1 Tax=Nonomuraea solani TaxID=1144553 RepID=A0A1H6EZ29_9ACTN|nr:MFS transporter [Nonomuraea solani]SEH02341.1 drug resistance transporter, EmrB/QacA subfamily [Nonomuraea solani]